MTSAARSICTPSLVAVMVLLSGCASESIDPIGGGFEELTYTRQSPSEPPAHRIALQFRDPSGKVMPIWPSLYGTTTVVNGDVAIFVGDVGEKRPSTADPQPTGPRLLAAAPSERPIDLTDAVLRLWSKQPGASPADVQRPPSIVFPRETSEGVELHFATGSRDLNVTLDWYKIADLMGSVRRDGVLRRDPVWHVEYLVAK